MVSEQHGEPPLFGLPTTTGPVLKLGQLFEATHAYNTRRYMSTSTCQICDTRLNAIVLLPSAEQHGVKLCKDWLTNGLALSDHAVLLKKFPALEKNFAHVLWLKPTHIRSVIYWVNLIFR
jgi:hypothetical protein